MTHRKKPRLARFARELIARRKQPGFRDLVRIISTVAELEHLVGEFRKAHPPGHRCAACDHVRETDKVNHPAGPSDAIVALHVAAWEFRNLLDDLNLGPVGPAGEFVSWRSDGGGK